ncbi:MAG: RAD55 family ATPase [Candidatus Thorarchaeota archaeon]
MNDRCSTGIEGLDSMLVGGIPRGRTVLVEGPPGTGKTIFSLHFLIEGIIRNPKEPEPGIFVCLDESPTDLIREARVFGWDLQRLSQLRMLIIIDGYSGRLGVKPTLPFAIPIGKFTPEAVMERIGEATREISAQRLVVDSVTALTDGTNGARERRKTVLSLAALLTRLSLTTLLTAEAELSINHSPSVERYAAHGVIRLSYEEEEDSSTVKRKLRIVKMRETMHSMDIIPFVITSHGIELKT